MGNCEYIYRAATLIYSSAINFIVIVFYGNLGLYVKTKIIGMKRGAFCDFMVTHCIFSNGIADFSRLINDAFIEASFIAAWC